MNASGIIAYYLFCFLLFFFIAEFNKDESEGPDDYECKQNDDCILKAAKSKSINTDNASDDGADNAFAAKGFDVVNCAESDEA